MPNDSRQKQPDQPETDQPQADQPQVDQDAPLPDLNDDFWDALLPDDEHEPLPERGDFWVEQDQQTESSPDA